MQVQIPTPMEINAVLPLMLKVTELVYEKTLPMMCQYAERVAKVLKSGVLLSSTLAKLQREKSIAAQLSSASDKDFRLLHLLKQTRVQYQENVASMMSMQGALACEQMLQSDAPFAAFPWAKKFQALIDDRTYQKIVDAQVEVFMTKLKEFADRLVQECKGMAQGQHSWWRADVANDAQIHVLSLLADETLTTLDPSVRKLPDVFLEEFLSCLGAESWLATCFKLRVTFGGGRFGHGDGYVQP